MRCFPRAGLTVIQMPRSQHIAHILVVEDDALLAFDLQQVLSRAGHDVIGLARSLDKALHLAETAKPDLALVDYRLDGREDGIMVARHLRQHGIKVIYVTASADEVRLIDGTTEIIPKPFDPTELLKAVERVIASAQSRE
jgi:two-component system, response regulator PdtaR